MELLSALVFILNLYGNSELPKNLTHNHQEGRFKKVATTSALGGPSESQKAIVDKQGISHLFVGYSYQGSQSELLEFVPSGSTIKTITYKLPDDDFFGIKAYQAIHSVVATSKGDIYFSTSPSGKIFKLDESRHLTVLDGDPLWKSKEGAYAWDLTVASDGNIYGVSYPGATFFSVDTSTDKVKLISRLKDDRGAKSEYARYVVSDSEGYVYIRTGITVDSALVYAYNTKTGAPPTIVNMPGHDHANALIAQFYFSGDRKKTFAQVQVKDDASGSKAERQFVELHDGTATLIEKLPNDALNKVSAGVSVPGADRFAIQEIGSHSVKWMPKGALAQTVSIDHPGKPIKIFRLGMGPDNAVYASAVIPAELFRYVPDTLSHVGVAGSGEVYGIYPLGSKVLLADYGAVQAIAVLDPAANSTASSVKYLSAPTSDPLAAAWRPSAGFADLAHKEVWIGSAPSYEKKDGVLVKVGLTESAESVQSWQPVSDRTIYSLTGLYGSDSSTVRALLLGTSTIPASGSPPRPAGSQGGLVVWNTSSKSVVGEPVNPLAGEQVETIFNLLPLGGNEVFGMARLAKSKGSRFAAFVVKWDGYSLTTVRSKVLDNLEIVPELSMNSIGKLGSKLIGLYYRGVFSIDPSSFEVAKYPYSGDPITAGFAIRGQGVYFGSGPNIIRFGFSDSD